MKGIPANEDLLDCIGRAELAANEFRITQTEEKLRMESIKGEQTAIQFYLAGGASISMRSLRPLPDSARAIWDATRFPDLA